ncbi:MAG: helix-turn-helix transcriptional regulator [Firmicutes bacterium]|nr:helix-turn-helix transcriptional regulator [Bacillota bacterium]
MSYGARIRALRLERGLKAKYVAQKIGLSASQYSDLEHDRKKLTADLIVGLVDVLRITADEILCATDADRKEA